MKRILLLLTIVSLILTACKSEKSPINKSNDSTNQTATAGPKGSASSTDGGQQKNSIDQVYQLKDDGLYVYSDGPAYYEKSGERCTKVVQKNYKYLKVQSSQNEIKFKKGSEEFQFCSVEKKCEDDLGKPSLKELGYERHKEREIKPEDNRFGVQVTKEKTYYVTEKKLYRTINYNVIPKSDFMILSVNEFLENGIVILGKNISRVVIKSLSKLPKFTDEVAIESFIKKYDCAGNITDSSYIEPYVIADFKKINFKENIFEFIREEPIQSNRGYLTDEEYMKLTNNLHQLVPRVYDQTIHNLAKYNEGYYLIEYYSGNVLYDYHCIYLSKSSEPPKLWNPLKVQDPKPLVQSSSSDMNRLVIAEFSSIRDAESFMHRNQISDALIYRRDNGTVFIGKSFDSKKEAEAELQRYANRGVKKESMKIERY